VTSRKSKQYLSIKQSSLYRESSFWTSSSAVAKRPRDASCLSVVSFNSTIPRAQFFIISYRYFGFGFTSAYNSILFCCLQRNVEPCCHIHDSRSTVTVYLRETALGRSRTVHSNGRRRLLIACRALSSNTRSKQKAGRKVRNASPCIYITWYARDLARCARNGTKYSQQFPQGVVVVQKSRFLTNISRFIWKTIQDSAVRTMEDEWKLVCYP